MKFVFASERTKLIRERRKYSQEYDVKKANYDKQTSEFESAYRTYADNMSTFIRSFLSAELEKLPDTKITVKQSSGYRDSIHYYIILDYRSNKRRNANNGNVEYRSRNYDYDIDSGYYRGISWKFAIYLDYRNKEGDVPKINKVPDISINLLDSDDYAELEATYTLFKKIDTIDWATVINQIQTGVPKREQYVTEEDPGYKDTSKWDKMISDYNINRIIGKDLWIWVYISREDSYDRYNSNNPGVDGHGWVQVTSATDKFYIFHWLDDTHSNNSKLFSKGRINQALNRTYKLKKIYIKPEEPIQYMTTEELTEFDVPSIEEETPQS